MQWKPYRRVVLQVFVGLWSAACISQPRLITASIQDRIFLFSSDVPPPPFPLPLLPFPFSNPCSLSQFLSAVESNPQARGISVQLFQGAADTHKVGWCAIQHPSSSFSSHSQWQSFVRMRCWMLWTKTVWGNFAGSGQPFKGKDAKIGVLEKESAGGEGGVLVLCRLHLKSPALMQESASSRWEGMVLYLK